MSPDKTTLLDLPQELLATVAQELTSSKLLVFRRTCRSLAIAATDTFDERCLHHQTLTFNEAGLRRLLSLTSDTALSKRIRKLEFQMSNSTPSREIGPDWRESFPDHSLAWKAWRGRKQDAMREDLYALVLQVMQGLAAISHSPAVAITSAWHPPVPPVVSGPTDDEVEEVEAAPPPPDFDKTAVPTTGSFVTGIIFQALVEAQVSIPAFELDVDLGATPLGVWDMIASGGLCVQNLRSVKLSIPGTAHKTGPSHEILELIRLAPNLESLDHRWVECYKPIPDEPRFTALMASLTTCRLQHLVLRSILLSTPALLSALRKVRFTLRKLEIINVKLLGEPCTWAGPLVWMSENLELEEVAFARLRMRGWNKRDHRIWLTDLSNDRFGGKGRSAIKALMENVAQDGRCESLFKPGLKLSKVW